MLDKNIKRLLFLLKNNFSNEKNCDQVGKLKHLIIVDRERYVPTFSLSIFSKAICNKFNLSPILVSDLKKDHNIRKIFESFNFTDCFPVFRIKILFDKWDIFLKTLYFFLYNFFIISFKPFNWIIKNFDVKGILIGDLVYDTYVRNHQKYKKPKKDFLFLWILFTTIFRVFNLKINLFDKKIIKIILVGTVCNSTNGAIAARIAIKKKIKVVEPFFYGFREHTEKTMEFGYYNQSVQKNISKIKNTDIKTAEKFFQKKFYKGFIGSYTGRKDILNQRKKSKKELLNKNHFLKKLSVKNNYKKIVLFASHAFSDAPHGLGRDFVFDDYYQFLKESLNYIKNNNDNSILWLIKPHPSSEWYGEQGDVEELVKNINYPNIKIFPDSISTLNGIKNTDLVITGRGTIGMEFAAFGKLSLILGSAPYSALNICKRVKTKKIYFHLLGNIGKIKGIRNDQKNLARKLLFFLENHKRNFLSTSKIFDNNTLKSFNSLNPEKRRKDHYVINNHLLNKLKEVKIYDDIFFKEIKKIIKL